MRSLGELLYTQGAARQAQTYLERALTIFAQRLGPQHPDTEQTRQALVTLDVTHNATDSGS